MKEKLLAIFNKVKISVYSLYIKAPFLLGLCVGYLFKPEIKLGLNLVAKLIKLI